MSKKHLCLSFLTAALLPWLLFSESLHDNVTRVASRLSTLFSADHTDRLAAQTRANMVTIKGGTFYFGKFDTQYGDQHYADQGFDSLRDLQEITIGDFAMSKYQVTYADYDIYTRANGLDPIEITDQEQKSLKEVNIPVLLTWQEASDYCQWLGKVMHKNMNLPTEIEWEYAARNRGQFVLYPTDSGIVEPGKNVPLETDKERTGRAILEDKLMPPGRFPPNPLGLYDLASNGKEWTADVYQESGYWARDNDKHKDDRIVRSQSMSVPGGAPTVYRSYAKKSSRNTARCMMVP